MELQGKRILITGGTSGIGRELALRLKVVGNHVVILGKDPVKLQAAESEGFQTICCDLACRESIENAVVMIQNEYPDLSILFNNAGVQFNYAITDAIIPLDKIEKEIQINLIGQITLTHLLIPILSNSPQAWIVNTTSGLGAFPKSDGLVYSASKAAFRNFTAGLRFALAKTSIKVIEFMPPVTDTAMTAGRKETKASVEQVVDTLMGELPRNRTLITVGKLRLFVWIAFLFPRLANRILSKG